jgi:multicomponent Na+:H+ antiporter subunit A
MLIAITAAPFLAALAAPWLQRATGRTASYLLALVPAVITIMALQAPPGSQHVASIPALGIALTLALDGLSRLFVLLIGFIGTFIILYAGAYAKGDVTAGRLQANLLFFMGSMLGLVLSDDIILLFVFWELTSLSSFFLIGHRHEDPEARSSALQALFVTGTGGLALFAGLILMAHVTGETSLAAMQATGGIREHALGLPILLLVLAGAAAKSAQWPLHFWLPNAMAAPTPVSAYLHSSTMVKAGVYLLARLFPILGGTMEWGLLLKIIGGTTMLAGAYLALHHDDLKRILAYSTMSILGSLIMLLGVGSERAIQAVVVVIVAHALYKGALFMVAGAIDHSTGVRDVTRLSGLRRRMPILAMSAMLAAASLAGLAPLFSFIGKELFFEALLYAEIAGPLLLVVAVVASSLLVVVAYLVGIKPFFGALASTPEEPHEPEHRFLAGPIVLSTLGILLGIYPALLLPQLLPPAAASILGYDPPLSLALWHGFTPAVAMSLIVLFIGFLVYRYWQRVHDSARWVQSALSRGPAWLYPRVVQAGDALSKWQASRIMNGSLRNYAAITVSVAFGGLLLFIALRVRLAQAATWTEVPVIDLVFVAVVVFASFAVATVGRRMTAVVFLGAVGYGIAALFLLYGAPDLGLTQILFETLSLILFVYVLRKMPRHRSLSDRGRRLRDAAVGCLVGLTVTLITAAVVLSRSPSRVSEYYAAASLALAHGRNVVNVILVDFRALDTMGEITVIVIAALGVFALIKLPLSGGNRQ